MKRKKSLKTTLVGVCVALAALVCAVVGAIGIFAVRSITNVAYDKYETAMDEGYNAEIKSQVQSVLAILQMEYDKVLAGDMSETEAQEEASEIVRAMRYRDDESGYFWIDDTDYVLVMHPILAEQEGSNRYDLEDQNGVMIIQEIMNSCLSADAGGFNEFYFTKADGVTVAPKIAYSGFFEPWGWAISTGNYVDDMKLDMQEVNNSIKKDFYTACAIMAGCCAVLIAFAAVISFIFGEIVVIPLRKMQSFAEKLSEGNLTEDVEVKQKNEIGVTAEKLNPAGQPCVFYREY
jgi:Signal transduction histidine kinase